MSKDVWSTVSLIDQCSVQEAGGRITWAAESLVSARNSDCFHPQSLLSS